MATKYHPPRGYRVTPCMAAGVTSRVWEIADLIALLPTTEGKKRGPYRKQGAAAPGEISN